MTSSAAGGRPDPAVPFEILPAVRLDSPSAGRRGADTRAGAGDEPPRATVFTGDVGAFRPGDPASRWALARYLVARTVGDGAVLTVLLIALAFVAGTVALVAVNAPVVLSVLVGLVAVGWLIGWRVVRAVWHRLTTGRALDAIRPELDRLVADTRPDVRHELRRIGLPAHPLAAGAFAVRLAGRRRADTLERLRGFDVERVVPPVRVDELYLLLERIEPVG